MKKRSYPKSSELRELLLKRQREYCDLEAVSPSALGRMIRKDSTLFTSIEAGRNITFDTYDEIMGWFDAHPPRPPASSA